METNVIIRLLKINDVPLLCQFFSENSTYKRDIAFWTWINRGLSYSISAIAVAEDKIIGHYAVVPRELRIDNVMIKAGLGIHAIVHPDYKDRVSIFEISSFCFKECQKRGIELVYGFPNSNYRIIQTKIERWKQVGLFKSLVLNTCDYKKPLKSEIFTCEKATKLMEIEYYKELLGNTLRENKVHLSVDSNFYSKRFQLHPQNNYFVDYFFEKNELIAMIIYKIFNKDGKNLLHIMDLNYKSSVNLLELISFFLSNHTAEVESFNFWPISIELNEIFKSLGFKDIGFETFFGIKTLSENSKMLVDRFKLENMDNWYLTMSDSDVF